MKVFQPGVFDKELACYARAQCGQVLTFSDVEVGGASSRCLHRVVVCPILALLALCKDVFAGTACVRMDRIPQLVLPPEAIFSRACRLCLLEGHC